MIVVAVGFSDLEIVSVVGLCRYDRDTVGALAMEVARRHSTVGNKWRV